MSSEKEQPCETLDRETLELVRRYVRMRTHEEISQITDNLNKKTGTSNYAVYDETAGRLRIIGVSVACLLFLIKEEDDLIKRKPKRRRAAAFDVWG